MEREYHISLNGKNLGTFSLTQLNERKLDSEAIVWYEGLDDWKPVTEVEELKTCIKSTPPPVPASQRKKILHAPGYLVMGILSAAIAFPFSSSVKLPTQIIASLLSTPMDINNAETSVLILLFRAFIAWLISDTMKLYNRSRIWWGLFGFFLPTLAMLVVAFVKPLKRRKPVTESKW